MALSGALKTAAMALCLLPVAFEAHAISRYQSTSMTCANIRATIEAEGAAILRWKQAPDLLRYERVVANVNYCPPHELWVQPTAIPSADEKECVVYVCERPPDMFPLPSGNGHER